MKREEVKTFDKLLGRYLSKLRRDKGISQEYLGELMNKGQSEIAKIEAGNKKIVVSDLVHWLAVLKIDMSNCLDELQALSNKYFDNHIEL